MSGAKFFAALLAPEPVAGRLRAVQHELRDRFGTRAALRSPPHVTVVPPFTCSEAEIEAVQAAAAVVCKQQRPFTITVDGFGCFAPRVIFAEPSPSEPLSSLHRALAAALPPAFSFIAHDDRPFHPHMTVAFRDLSPQGFAEAWPMLRDRPFAASFTVSELWFLRLGEPGWQPERALSLG